jgi:hypothetical protein
MSGRLSHTVYLKVFKKLGEGRIGTIWECGNVAMRLKAPRSKVPTYRHGKRYHPLTVETRIPNLQRMWKIPRRRKK